MKTLKLLLSIVTLSRGQELFMGRNLAAECSAVLTEGSIGDLSFSFDENGVKKTVDQTAIKNSDPTKCPMTCEVINHEGIKATSSSDGSKIEFPTNVIAGYSTGFWLKCSTNDGGQVLESTKPFKIT